MDYKTIIVSVCISVFISWIMLFIHKENTYRDKLKLTDYRVSNYFRLLKSFIVHVKFRLGYKISMFERISLVGDYLRMQHLQIEYSHCKVTRSQVPDPSELIGIYLELLDWISKANKSNNIDCDLKLNDIINSDKEEFDFINRDCIDDAIKIINDEIDFIVRCVPELDPNYKKT